jgi:hypothetical protein
MTIIELKQLLNSCGLADECILPPEEKIFALSSFVMKKTSGGKYKVYGFDRGYEYDVQVFENEHTACIALLELGLVYSDPRIAKAVELAKAKAAA